MLNEDNLQALLINTSLEKQPSDSHAAALLKSSAHFLKKAGVEVEHVHFLSHAMTYGHTLLSIPC